MFCCNAYHHLQHDNGRLKPSSLKGGDPLPHHYEYHPLNHRDHHDPHGHHDLHDHHDHQKQKDSRLNGNVHAVIFLTGGH